MQGKHQREAVKIANRIRQAIVQRRSLPLDFDVDVATLPPVVRGAHDPLAAEVENAEEAELEADVVALHDNWNLAGIDLVPPQRRFRTPFVLLVRKFVARLFRPFLQHQTVVNASIARSMSILRNKSIRHENVFGAGIQALVPAVRSQAKAIAELDRRLRILELSSPNNTHISLDALKLAEQFRGTEAEIRERQRPYLQYFDNGHPILDLGSGRGEFLELLRDAGISGRGVDSDPRMVEHARRKGLAVDKRDALSALEDVPPGSLGGVFAAQLVEHLVPEDVVRLVQLSHRALGSAGRLIIETPNPEALIVFASFYLDPTHVRPYNAGLLKWFLEQEGFVDVSIEYLLPQKNREPEGEVDALLYGYQAYAAIGTKPPITE